MTSVTNGQKAFSNTPAAIATALRPPQTGLTLVRIAQDLRPGLGWQPGTHVQACDPSETYVTLTV